MSELVHKKFLKWLDEWWREHHPHGGGLPPTLEEAFEAGRQVEREEKPKRSLFTEEARGE
jgi:hypothetical protein